MKKTQPESALPADVATAQIWTMCEGFFATEADNFRLKTQNRDLVIGRGRVFVARLKQRFEENGSEDATAYLQTLRVYARVIAGQFHDLEELDDSWTGTIYPTIEVLLYFWARASRSRIRQLVALLGLREEFRSRIDAIVKIVVGHMIPQEKRTRAGMVIEEIAQAFATVIIGRVEKLLGETTSVAVDFREPNEGLESLEAFEDAIAAIPDSKLPALPFEVYVVDCVEKFVFKCMLRSDNWVATSEALRSWSFDAIEEVVAVYVSIALGLSLH
jgi:hypothetical protein